MLKKAGSKQNPAKTITDADDIVLLPNTPGAGSWRHWSPFECK